MKQAMREKQRSKLNVIKTIISDIGYAEKSTQPFSVITEDDQVAPIIYRAIKKRSESIEQYRQGGRDDLVSSEKEEVEILQSYLPTPYTEEELLIQIDNAIKATSSTTVKDLGKVLKALTLDPSRAPKSLVAQLVKGRLSAQK
ncbi:hypothetical protein DSO57_1025859 [Entomophthora muscae]|uniref:Uncharacterized protein n=1 Tax=Entomophthora muscae TaxID=34485 RepID=A0ACC2TPH9_9FUNG|nr:hypothetical protein DSO57_1025859 [Entomophthora muscae]